MKRQRYCDIRATSLEEILETCNRHIKNFNMTSIDLLDNEDGTETDFFYIDTIRGMWQDMRDDVQQMLEVQNGTSN